jgi:REP element-mobilizing transposase RayT
VYAPSEIVKKIKSITVRKIFEACPEVKKQLWGEEFWTRGYFIETVGEHGDERVIREYVKNQGRDMVKYKEVYCDKQLTLFD